MAHNFLVLQHADWEPPGRLLLEAAEQLGITLRISKIYQQAPPDPADFEALLLLGGPQNVNQLERYPFLKEEKRLLKAWLTMDRPCLGFCLGHQLLAEALGAQIGRNFTPNIGFTRGHLTHCGSEHPVFKGINSPFPLFKWHSQAIQTPLPRELLMLATSSQCVVEAFGVAGRPHIIGLQCDNHAAHPEDINSWLEHDRGWISGLENGKSLASELPRQIQEQLPVTSSIFLQIMRNFITIIEQRR